MAFSPLLPSLLSKLRLPQLREKYENIQENGNNTKGRAKGEMTKSQRSRVGFEKKKVPILKT